MLNMLTRIQLNLGLSKRDIKKKKKAKQQPNHNFTLKTLFIFLPQCFPEGTDMVAILDFYFQVSDFKIETRYRLKISIISSRS